LQRINKVLAASGLGSRRHVDELIEQGRVEIDGQTITQVGVKVDLSTASISVDGELLKQHRPVYYALHKPEGVLCTNRDPQGRPRVIDFVPNQQRLFPVGRLDASSTGLILLTNDGELAQQLTHPKHEIPKRYSVVVVGQVELDALKRLERGIYIAEGKTQVDQAKLKKVRKSSTELEITLSEGKNREIRRVLARLGHKVVSLKRIAIGPLKLADLPEGAYRPLSNHEVQGLYQAVEDIRRERKAARKARKKLSAATETTESTSEALPKGKPDKFGKPVKAGKAAGKPSDKFPSLSTNRLDYDEDLDDQPIENQNDEMILIRDQGPDNSNGQDSDEEYLFIPRKKTGSVIGQEEDSEDALAADSEGIEFELFDSDDDDQDEDYDDIEDEDHSPKKGLGKPTRAGQSNGRKKQVGQKQVGQKNGGQKDSSESGGRKPSGMKRGGRKSGGSKRDSQSELVEMGLGDYGSEKPTRGRGGPKRGGPKRSGPSSGGPRSSGPRSSGGPRSGGGPKSGGPKRGGPKRGGPKSGGGPKRGGRSGRSRG
jgi:23S rRNA pseudouridine2605 synthase